MTGRRATHCRHGHDIAVCGRHPTSHTCLECRRLRNRPRYSGTPRPDARKWIAIEDGLRIEWEANHEPARSIAARYGLPSKSALVGLAYRRGWEPRRIQWQRTMADRLDALARAFEAAVQEARV